MTAVDTVEKANSAFQAAKTPFLAGSYLEALHLLQPTRDYYAKVYLPKHDPEFSAGFLLTTHTLAKCLNSLKRFDDAEVLFEELLQECKTVHLPGLSAKITIWEKDHQDNLYQLTKQEIIASETPDSRRGLDALAVIVEGTSLAVEQDPPLLQNSSEIPNLTLCF